MSYSFLSIWYTRNNQKHITYFKDRNICLCPNPHTSDEFLFLCTPVQSVMISRDIDENIYDMYKYNINIRSQNAWRSAIKSLSKMKVKQSNRFTIPPRANNIFQWDTERHSNINISFFPRYFLKYNHLRKCQVL